MVHRSQIGSGSPAPFILRCGMLPSLNLAAVTYEITHSLLLLLQFPKDVTLGISFSTCSALSCWRCLLTRASPHRAPLGCQW